MEAKADPITPSPGHLTVGLAGVGMGAAGLVAALDGAEEGSVFFEAAPFFFTAGAAKPDSEKASSEAGRTKARVNRFMAGSGRLGRRLRGDGGRSGGAPRLKI